MFTLLLLWSASIVLTAAREVWWNITYVENVNPDGLYPRRVIGVNGTWPPPPLSANTSEPYTLHVFNSLNEQTTIHHHGLFFNGTGWNDGVRGVTQCGIGPGQSFSYHVPVEHTGQWGTYWVHSHAGAQYVDGLRAPFVLHPQKEAYAGKYDDEYTVVISDWYHQQTDVLLKQYINIANVNGTEPIPDSPLIYFARGTINLGPKQNTGSTVDPTASAVGFNENSTLPFQPGKTYRLRIINTSGFAGFFFWIDGHKMRIIEADGTDVEETSMDVLSLSVGQRYSVLVTARNDKKPSNWAIHANMDTAMFDDIPRGLIANTTSSITYSPHANVTDLSPAPADFYRYINDTALVPYVVRKQLPPATMTVPLEVSFGIMTDGINRAMLNNVTYNYPKVPSLFTQVEYASQNINQSAYGLLAFVLNHLDVVDIVLKNADNKPHPFHLHGHIVQIVNRAANYSSSDPALNPPLIEGQANPMRRDVIQVGAFGSVTFRFVADNPGTWFFHCHMDWHLAIGLAAAFVSSTPQLVNASTPQWMLDQCTAQGLLSQGNAAGNLNPNNLTGLPIGPFPQNPALGLNLD